MTSVKTAARFRLGPTKARARIGPRQVRITCGPATFYYLRSDFSNHAPDRVSAAAMEAAKPGPVLSLKASSLSG
jgi:hypothetical protein